MITQAPTRVLRLVSNNLLSAIDRYQLLPNDDDFVFDFNQTDGTGFADAKTFPALVGTGASMAFAEVPGTSPEQNIAVEK